MNNFIPTIDQLPSAPLWQRMIFEEPWAAMGALLLMGVCALVIANRQGRLKRGAVVASFFVAAGMGLALAAAMVRTDHEAIRQGTREFIAAAATGDTAKVERLLAPDAALNVEGMSTFSLGKDELVAGVESIGQEIGPGNYRTLERTASVDGRDVGRSRVVVRVDVRSAGPSFSSWEFAWRRGDDGMWTVRRLICLSVNGRQPGPWFTSELVRALRSVGVSD